jgi:hypothetical protein
MDTVHAVVLEYPRDLGERPSLLVGSTPDAVTRELVRELGGQNTGLVGGLAGFCSDHGSWLEANPVPDPDATALDDLDTWLNSLHEWLDGFWWTEFMIDLPTLAVETAEVTQ